MKKLMLLLVIAFALPACGKKNQPAPAKPAGDMPAEPAADPNKAGEGGEGTTPADPCAGKTADPCGGGN